jgi:hypothetical protein
VLTTHRHPQLLLGPPAETPPLSRAQRAHWRLPWAEPLARNARAPTADSITIRLFGILAAFATSLGLATACTVLGLTNAPWPRSSRLLRWRLIAALAGFFCCFSQVVPISIHTSLVLPLCEVRANQLRTTFVHQIRGELLGNLVAHRVGLTNGKEPAP